MTLASRPAESSSLLLLLEVSSKPTTAVISGGGAARSMEPRCMDPRQIEPRKGSWMLCWTSAEEGRSACLGRPGCSSHVKGMTPGIPTCMSELSEKLNVALSCEWELAVRS